MTMDRSTVMMMHAREGTAGNANGRCTAAVAAAYLSIANNVALLYICRPSSRCRKPCKAPGEIRSFL